MSLLQKCLLILPLEYCELQADESVTILLLTGNSTA